MSTEESQTIKECSKTDKSLSISQKEKVKTEEAKKLKESVFRALHELDEIKAGKKKAHPIDTLWDEI